MGGKLNVALRPPAAALAAQKLTVLNLPCMKSRRRRMSIESDIRIQLGMERDSVGHR